jgi:cobalt-zinc-cadmium efflux system membrane fusion protein
MRMHRFHRRTPLLFSAISLTVLVVACGKEPVARAAEPAPTARRDTATLSAQALEIAGFSLDTATTIAWRGGVSASARLILDPAGVETIGSIVEGRIFETRVRVGDVVRAGDVLVTIHSHELMDARSAQVRAASQVTVATAERSVAVAAAERAHRLFDAKAMSRAEVERADAARVSSEALLEQALAERERANVMVEHLVGTGPTPPNVDPHDVLIRSPIAGVVTAREAQPGAVVLPGAPLVTVGDPQRLLLQMRLPEPSARGVTSGASVRYVFTDEPLVRYDATVTRIAPTVDTLTRTVEVLASPTGRARRGRAESFAQAEILGTAGSPAIVVPVSAIQALDGDTVVIAAETRGAGLFVEAVAVRIGRRSTTHVEVVSGLEVGRAVIAARAAIAKAELLKRRSGSE